MISIDPLTLHSTGMPLYDMRKIFEKKGEFSEVTMSLVHIMPGQRVPEEGFSCHDSDEYSYIVSGEIVEEAGIQKAGMASLIPRGEEHWCRNDKDEPCVIACFMVK